MTSIWMAAVLIALAGLYTVSSVGVTGGPNHGEHPFTVTIVHMILFAFLGRHWPGLSLRLYWGGLIAALVLSVIALGKTFDEDKGWRVLVRVPLGLLYAGFLVVLFKRPS
jgi:Na+-driven multidrug efflux pump